jgi:hypothetical protein
MKRIGAGALETTQGKPSAECLAETFEGASRPTEYSLDPTPAPTREFSSSRLSIAPMMEVLLHFNQPYTVASLCALSARLLLTAR